MTKSEIFASNLRRLTRGLSPAVLEKQTRVSRKLLARWLTRGISRPTGMTADALEKLVRHLNFGCGVAGRPKVEIADLWKEPEAKPEVDWAERLKAVLDFPFNDNQRKAILARLEAGWVVAEGWKLLRPEVREWAKGEINQWLKAVIEKRVSNAQDLALLITKQYSDTVANQKVDDDEPPIITKAKLF